MPTDTLSITPTSNNTRRLAILLAIGLALHVLLLRWTFLTSPSERFHALVPLLFLADLSLFRWKTLNTAKRWGLCSAVFVGGGFLWLFFAEAAGMLAYAIGGTISPWEPVYKVTLTASELILYSMLVRSVTALTQLAPALRTLLQSPGGWWLRGLRGAVTLLLFGPCIYASFNVHRFKIGNGSTPRSELNLNYKAVTFAAAEDHLPLSGWFIPSPGSASTVLLCHGIGSNKSDLLALVPFLHRAGYNVFSFDFRGHGESAGHTTSFGYYESRDVRGAVQFLTSRPDSQRIAVCALSMGGAALLHAAGQLPQLRCLVVDSTFADFPTVAVHQTAFLGPDLSGALVCSADLSGRLESGATMAQMSSRAYVAALPARPLLIIHGATDGLIPASEALANFRAAKEPKQLWIVPGADHCRAHQVATAEYEANVLRFLKAAM